MQSDFRPLSHVGDQTERRPESRARLWNARTGDYGRGLRAFSYGAPCWRTKSKRDSTSCRPRRRARTAASSEALTPKTASDVSQGSSATKVWVTTVSKSSAETHEMHVAPAGSDGGQGLAASARRDRHRDRVGHRTGCRRNAYRPIPLPGHEICRDCSIAAGCRGCWTS